MSFRVARAGSWGLTGRVVLLLANFAAAPFTIRLLGPAAFGLWSLLTTVFTYANLAEGGMGSATTKYGSERYAHGDDRGEAEIVWTAATFVIVTTFVVAVVFAICAHPILVLLHVPKDLLGPGSTALRLMCVSFVLNALTWTAGTPLQVRLRWRPYTLLNVASNLIVSIGVPLAIYIAGGGVVVAAAASVVGSAVLLIGLAWKGVRVQPALKHVHFEWATLRKLIFFGGFLTLANFIQIPIGTAGRFILAHDVSTTAVAYYAVAATVATALNIIPQQIVAPLVPAFTRLAALGKAEELKALFRKCVSGMFLLVTPAVILLAFVAKPFLTLWAGPAYGAHSTVLMIVVLGGVWGSCASTVAKQYMVSAAMVKTIAWLSAIELPFYVGAAWVLIGKWGALGLAIVWSARSVLDCIAKFVIVHRSAGLPLSPLSRRPVRSLGAPALLGLSCLGVAAVTPEPAARFGSAVVLLALYSAVVWSVVLTRGERRGLIALIRHLLGRKVAVLASRPAHARKRRGAESHTPADTQSDVRSRRSASE